MKNKHLLFIGLIVMSCSSGRYTIADRYLEQQDYQNAVQEYLRIAEQQGSLALSHDVRALLGAMIAYYHLGDYKKSFALTKRVLSLDKYNSCAIFYGGMNLEMLDKEALARKVFYFYHVLSRSDPFYKFIKAKFTELMQKEMEKRAQTAIQVENSISADQIDNKTLGVLYFLNVVDNPEWNVISKGLAEMMITDLSQVKAIKVVERVYLQKLLEEMQLGISGLADESTIPRLGRLLKARNLINGFYSIQGGQNLIITSDLVDVVSQSGLPAKEFSGALKDIFTLEKKIVFSVLDELGIELTVEEKKKIGKYATQNLEAFKAYCLGLDQFDNGNFRSARSHFEQAMRLDPAFMLARDMFETTEAFEIIDQKQFSMLHLNLIQSKFLPGTGMATIDATLYRLNQLSLNLDLGYMPGNDSRNGASEIIAQPQFWSDDWQEGEVLAPPPLPPANPPINK